MLISLGALRGIVAIAVLPFFFRLSVGQLYENEALFQASKHWTTPPVCARNSMSGQEYCAFSAARFAGGRGISIVTTSEQGQYFAKTPAFQDRKLHDSLGVNQLHNPPFERRTFKDRGVGLVANRSIARGEWLMNVTPAYMILSDISKDLNNKVRRELQNIAFLRLPDQVRSLTDSLARQGLGDFVDDITATNSFAFNVPTGQNSETRYAFVFPEIARFNHDCRPNAFYTFDDQTLSLQVSAIRDIFPGEELTVTYIGPLKKRKERLRALKRAWGFGCRCSLCTASKEVAAASDARIDKIIELQDELEESFNTPDITVATTVSAEKIISLSKEDQLWPIMYIQYLRAARQYSGIGNAQKAKAFAKLSLQSGFLCRRSSHEGFTEYSMAQSILENPRRHDTWMYLRS